MHIIHSLLLTFSLGSLRSSSFVSSLSMGLLDSFSICIFYSMDFWTLIWILIFLFGSSLFFSSSLFWLISLSFIISNILGTLDYLCFLFLLVKYCLVASFLLFHLILPKFSPLFLSSFNLYAILYKGISFSSIFFGIIRTCWFWIWLAKCILYTCLIIDWCRGTSYILSLTLLIEICRNFIASFSYLKWLSRPKWNANIS